MILLMTCAATARQIDFFIGYVDQLPAPVVANASIEQTVMTALLKPCPLDQVAVCGFHLSMAANARVFERIHPNGGLDRVRLFSAAYSARDSLNRNMFHAAQESLSQQTASAFATSLEETSAVIYVGHARFGWGPDFSPPQLTVQGGVDKAYYKRESQLGNGSAQFFFHRMIQATDLGIFACDSAGTFLSGNKSELAHVRVVGTNSPVTPEAATGEALDFLAGLLAKLN
jgi:hypothetical protein